MRLKMLVVWKVLWPLLVAAAGIALLTLSPETHQAFCAGVS